MGETINYKEDYLGFLDGIRGLMAFWVFIVHLRIYCVGDVLPWLSGGATAVDVFMLLSGFLMAYHWKSRRSRFESFTVQTKDFYLRRLFRIVPLYYLLLTVAFLSNDYFSRIIHFINGHVTNSNLFSSMVDWANAKNMFMHYSFLFGLFPGYSDKSLLPDWSISLEMQFYLIFPLIILLARKFGVLLIAILAVVLSLITNNLFGLYHSYKMLGNFPQPSLVFLKLIFL